MRDLAEADEVGGDLARYAPSTEGVGSLNRAKTLSTPIGTFGFRVSARMAARVLGENSDQWLPVSIGGTAENGEVSLSIELGNQPVAPLEIATSGVDDLSPTSILEPGHGQRSTVEAVLAGNIR